jgi:hypothetical protein
VSDIFREVDEDLKRDSMDRLWKKYGSYVIGAATAFVAIAAAFIAWQEWSQRQSLEQGVRLVEAMTLVENDRTSEGLAAYGLLAQEGSGGFALLARLQEAALAAQEGDIQRATTVYQDIADDSGLDQFYRDLATLLSVLNRVDSGDAATMIQQLTPLSGIDNPLHYSARETMGMVELRGGNKAAARKIFTDLSEDLEAPGPLQARAAEMLEILGGKDG